MSTIDRAFVKAFAKEKSTPTAPPEAVGAAEANRRSDDASVAWIDPVDDHYLRLDSAQPVGEPHVTRPRGGQPARPDNPGEGEGDGHLAHPEATASGRAGAAQPWDAQLFAPITIESQGFHDILSSQATATADLATPPKGNATKLVAASEPVAAAAAPATADDEVPSAEGFEAAWEVDRFELPEVVVQLLTRGGLLTAAGIPLTEACRGGLKSLLVTSPGRGEGKTSVAMGLALTVASQGLRVALLDGDCRSAALADRFRLDIQFGWAEAIRGGWALEETAVHAIEDALTLLPLVPSEDGKGVTADELGRAVLQLREQFDLVIVDAGSSDDGWPSDLPRRIIDAALVIRDVRIADAESLAICLETLQAAGITSLGLADNFTDA